MATWNDLQQAEPELADWGQKRFERARIAYLATQDASGALAISPVTPVICGGQLVIFVRPETVKARNLGEGVPFALHSAVYDPSSQGGEFLVVGSAHTVSDEAARQQAIAQSCYTPPAEARLFVLDIQQVTASEYDESAHYQRTWQAPVAAGV